jgi:hypothetical protein
MGRQPWSVEWAAELQVAASQDVWPGPPFPNQCQLAVTSLPQFEPERLVEIAVQCQRVERNYGCRP